jgi:hypothetical protein
MAKHKVYPRLVREFYRDMRITHFSPDGPVLETTVRVQAIKIDPALITTVTDIPVVQFQGLPFLDSVDPPTWDDMQLIFDPQQNSIPDWSKNMRSISMGWLQSPQRLLAHIMLQNFWPVSRNSNLILKRARFLYALIQRIPFCMCKRIVMNL